MSSPVPSHPDVKPTILHTEKDHDPSVVGHCGPKHGHHANNAAGKDFTVDDSALPEGYYKTVHFWGSMFAIGISVSCGVAGFSFIAPLLSIVNADLGPSPDISWVALTYTLTGAVGLMIVGRLTGMSYRPTTHKAR